MGTGLDHAFIVHFDKLICMTCFLILCCILYKSLYLVDFIWNTRVRKHNLGGLKKKNKLKMIVRELN